jgi:osmoprotectant transport system permease protein
VSGPRNPVLLALMIVAAVSIAATGFVGEAPNRLVSGRPIALWDAVDGPTLAGIAALGLALAAAAFLRQGRRLHGAAIVGAAGLLLLLLYGAGEAATSLAASASPAARTSLGPAFWIASLSATLVIVDALQRLEAGPLLRLVIALVVIGLIGVMAAHGLFDSLSIMREYAIRRSNFAAELGRHCALVFGALVPAVAIGVPLGLVAARRPRQRAGIFSALNLLQTIPSVALFGLLIAPLSALAVSVPALGAIGVRGIGAAPAIVALTLYSLLPVVRNTETGIVAVDPAVIETAIGMGMTPRQIFWRVELPLGLPVFLAGLRIVMVQAIGLAVVAALVGAGGLGSFVFQGLGQYAIDLILLGALPTIFLALAADFAMRLLITLAARRRSP